MRAQSCLLAFSLVMGLATRAAAQGQPPVAPAAPEPVIVDPHLHATSGPVHEKKTDWGLTLMPYFWLASIGINTGRSASVDIDPGDLAQLLRGAFMINTEAHYKDFGIMADYMFVKLQKSRDLGQSGDGDAKLEDTTNILNLRGSYRVLDTRHEGKGSVGTQLMLDTGVRYWNLGASLKVDIPPLLPNGQGIDKKLNGDDQWWDWTVGGHVRTDVTKRVGLGLSGSVGGFNIANSSKFTWEITTGVIFHVWKCLQLDVGYRALQVIRDGSDLKGDLKTRRITLNGLLIGLGVSF